MSAPIGWLVTYKTGAKTVILTRTEPKFNGRSSVASVRPVFEEAQLSAVKPDYEQAGMELQRQLKAFMHTLSTHQLSSIAAAVADAALASPFDTPPAGHAAGTSTKD